MLPARPSKTRTLSYCFKYKNLTSSRLSVLTNKVDANTDAVSPAILQEIQTNTGTAIAYRLSDQTILTKSKLERPNN